MTTYETMTLSAGAVTSEYHPRPIVDAKVEALGTPWTDSAIVDAVDTGRLTPGLDALLAVSPTSNGSIKRA